MRLPFREPVNTITHLIGALLSLLGLLLLIFLARGEPLRLLASLVYGISLILVFVSSSLYHGADVTADTRQWLHKLDHATIYLLIGGTYTPFCLLILDGEWRWLLLGLVWALALGGVVYKLLYLTKPGWFSLIYYLLLGAVGAISPPRYLQMIPPVSVIYLLAGGLVMVIGCLVFGLEEPNLHPLFGYHELWHIFVLLGSGLFYLAVLQALLA